LTSLVIPEGIKSIGSSAFECCSSLTNIVLPESIEELCENAISIYDNIEFNNYEGGYYIGTSTNPYACLVLYTGESSNNTCVIHENTKLIGSHAFETSIEYLYENDITSITIPQNVAYINSYAFISCPFTE
jgi:hypothetical protein